MSNISSCPCSGRSLPRLLRPGIMAVLAHSDAYGYQIAQNLSGMHMFDGRDVDHPGLYRALKDMAKEGLVTSSWETGDSGPARRMFALTAAGQECIETWRHTLCGYRDAIDELVALLPKEQA